MSSCRDKLIFCIVGLLKPVGIHVASILDIWHLLTNGTLSTNLKKNYYYYHHYYYYHYYFRQAFHYIFFGFRKGFFCLFCVRFALASRKLKIITCDRVPFSTKKKLQLFQPAGLRKTNKNIGSPSKNIEACTQSRACSAKTMVAA